MMCCNGMELPSPSEIWLLEILAVLSGLRQTLWILGGLIAGSSGCRAAFVLSTEVQATSLLLVPTKESRDFQGEAAFSVAATQWVSCSFLCFCDSFRNFLLFSFSGEVAVWNTVVAISNRVRLLCFSGVPPGSPEELARIRSVKFKCPLILLSNSLDRTPSEILLLSWIGVLEGDELRLNSAGGIS